MMKLTKRVERYLNLIEYRVQAKIKQNEEEVKIIDMALDKVKNQLTEQDTEELLLYLKEQAENADANTNTEGGSGSH